MKVIIFGLGSIGIRHAKILKSIPDVQLFAFRSKKGMPVNTLGIEEIFSWEEVEKIKGNVALIANPTFLHVETALKCAKLGMHLFIEKPLSNNCEGVFELKSFCRKNKLICYTAYCLRFHAVVKKIKEIIDGKKLFHVRIVCSSNLPDWRKNTDSKSSYSSSVAQGGGVLLDLSHEFDYIQYLFGEIDKMQAVFGRASNVTQDAEDFADVLIKMNSSLFINLHLNFLSLINERSIKIDFKHGYLVADLVGDQIEYSYDNKKEILKLNMEKDACLREQINYFLNSLSNKQIMNNLDESIPLLEKILELKDG
ncbi:MAG: Gfo/Idh/MocA family oxidoreductase [Candidatus Saganbacteria bacterium]|nr:Gfo/Idh/MocA family oxidoreductase [Candidatus Saganbacteria bacterium]